MLPGTQFWIKPVQPVFGALGSRVCVMFSLLAFPMETSGAGAVSMAMHLRCWSSPLRLLRAD